MKCAKVLKCRQVWVVQLMEAERREDYNVREGEVIVYHDDSEGQEGIWLFFYVQWQTTGVS